MVQFVREFNACGLSSYSAPGIRLGFLDTKVGKKKKKKERQSPRPRSSQASGESRHQSNDATGKRNVVTRTRRYVTPSDMKTGGWPPREGRPQQPARGRRGSASYEGRVLKAGPMADQMAWPQGWTSQAGLRNSPLTRRAKQTLRQSVARRPAGCAPPRSR